MRVGFYMIIIIIIFGSFEHVCRISGVPNVMSTQGILRVTKQSDGCACKLMVSDEFTQEEARRRGAGGEGVLKRAFDACAFSIETMQL